MSLFWVAQHANGFKMYTMEMIIVLINNIKNLLTPEVVFPSKNTKHLLITASQTCGFSLFPPFNIIILDS